MKWDIGTSQMGHLEMLLKLVDQYPETRQTMLDCLGKITPKSFKTILNDLVEFDIPIRLTAERATFMLKLLQFRRQHLLTELEK